MEKLQIQPGNLCQFLPQDVVRDFPQMTHQEIFYNTVKVPVHIVTCLLGCWLITFSLAGGRGGGGSDKANTFHIITFRMTTRYLF
jgi:hypothetical protein